MSERFEVYNEKDIKKIAENVIENYDFDNSITDALAQYGFGNIIQEYADDIREIVGKLDTITQGFNSDEIRVLKTFVKFFKKED